MAFSLFLRTFVIFAYHLGPFRVPQIRKPLKQTVQLLEVTYCLNVFVFIPIVNQIFEYFITRFVFKSNWKFALKYPTQSVDSSPTPTASKRRRQSRVQRQRRCSRRRFRSLQMRQSNKGRTPKKNRSEVRQCHETGLRH